MGSDTLSRLKGIETSAFLTSSGFLVSFRYAFPFEENWNDDDNEEYCKGGCRSDTLSRLKGIETHFRGCGGCRTIIVQIRFPVWRELKHYYLSFFVHFFSFVQIRFPVWRELKPWQKGRCRLSPVLRFRYAFPFEGNWNLFPFTQKVIFFWFRYAFPFEGNWNLVILIPKPQWSRLLFRYAFPFEGNWNTISIVLIINASLLFRYAFPFEGNWNRDGVAG